MQLKSLHQLDIPPHLRAVLSGHCYYCERPFNIRGTGTQATKDHIVPKVRGGSNSPRNLVTCCSHCNSCKSDFLPNELADIIKRYCYSGISHHAINKLTKKFCRNELLCIVDNLEAVARKISFYKDDVLRRGINEVRPLKNRPASIKRSVDKERSQFHQPNVQPDWDYIFNQVSRNVYTGQSSSGVISGDFHEDAQVA